MAVAEPPIPVRGLRAAHARDFAGRADVTVSHPRFLEFVAPGVSKGQAIAWLARRARCPAGATLALGDQCNDLEMVGDVGHGAAMPTAPAEVRLAARYLAPPVADDGAARLIEQLVLAPPDVAARNAARLAGEAAEVHAALARRHARRRRVGQRRDAGGPGAVTQSRILPDGDEARAEAVEHLRAGGIVALPTDTVYGIAADMALPDAIERLFAAKQRPAREGGRAPASPTPSQASFGWTWPPAATCPWRAVLAGRPDARAAVRAGVILPDALAGAHDDRRPRPGSRAPARARRGPRPAAHDLRQPLRRADARDAQAIADDLGDAVALVLDGGPSTVGLLRRSSTARRIVPGRSASARSA